MHQKRENQQALTIRNLLIFFPFVYFCFPFNCFDPKLFIFVLVGFITYRQDADLHLRVRTSPFFPAQRTSRSVPRHW